MAINSNVYLISDTRVYNSTKPILNKQLMAVFLRQVLEDSDIWIRLKDSEFDLINNAAVIKETVLLSDYDEIEVRVVDSVDELTTSPSDLAIVAGITNDIQSLGAITEEIVELAEVIPSINLLAPISQELVDISKVTEQIKTVNDNMEAIEEIISEPLKTEILSAKNNANTATTKADEASTSATNAKTSETNAAESAEDAQINEWGAEADARTAESYATEPEDVFVKIWKSNGDGTFSYTNSTDYSALHYAEKAAAGVSVDWGNIEGDITTQIDLNTALNSKASKQGDTNVTFKAANGINVNDVVNFSQVFGVGQSYVNVTSSRKLNSNYVNTTGKPIAVSVVGGPSAVVSTVLYVNGVRIAQGFFSASNGLSIAFCIVPANATYKATVSTNQLESWNELR